MRLQLLAAAFVVLVPGIAGMAIAGDRDGDGVDDTLDNCLDAGNAGQTDTDGDGFGNRCDPDFNNDNRVDFADLAFLKARFFGSDPLTDLSGDGKTDFADLAIMKSMFFDQPGPGVASGRVLGTVAGTSILIVGNDGNIITIDDTADREPDIDSDGDGIRESFTFVLPRVPVNEAVRIFLVRSGRIFPMYFDSTGDDVPDTNVFRFDAPGDLDLGFVDTEIVWQPGKAVPHLSPAFAADISAGPEDPVIPIGIGTPPTDGLSLAELNTRGLGALGDGWYTGARTYFEAAAGFAGSSASAEADTARFFFATTRIVAIGFNTLSDGNAADMDQLGDFLDLYGVANDETRGNWDVIEKPAAMPADAPRGAAIQDFSYTLVSAELRAAIATLNKVSSSFNANWKEPVNGELVESDYGDVLFFKSLFKSMLASIAIQRAYDLDADVDAVFNPNNDADPLNDIKVEEFLADSRNDSIASLSDTGKLGEAKPLLLDALDDMDDAVDAMTAETDDQLDDFITLDDLTNESTATAKDFIADARNSILGTDSIFDQNDTDASNDWNVHLDRFFDIGVDFRTPDRLPPFSGNDVSGLFPDPTFNGVVLAPDPNEDTAPADGIPDVAQ